MTDTTDTANDGQHRQAARYSMAMLTVDNEGLKLLARHLVYGKCRPDDPEAEVPVTFTVDPVDMTIGTIICNKALGQCKVSIQEGSK